MHAAHQPPIGWQPYQLALQQQHQQLTQQQLTPQQQQQHMSAAMGVWPHWMYPSYYYPHQSISTNTGYPQPNDQNYSQKSNTQNLILNTKNTVHHHYSDDHLEKLKRSCGAVNDRKNGVQKHRASPPVPKLEPPVAQKKCVNVCADWCNRNLSTSPVYDGRDDDIDSVLSRSSNGSLSPHHPVQSTVPWTDPFDPLSRWLSTHRHRPYPTKREKQRLAEMSGRSIEEISSWLSSARRELKRNYDEEQELLKGSARFATEMPDSWRIAPERSESSRSVQEMAERVPMMLQTIPLAENVNTNLGSEQISIHVTSGDGLCLSSLSPRLPQIDSNRLIPVLLPESSTRQHTRCNPSPDLLSPLVMDIDQSGRRTADIDIDQSGRRTADIDIDQSGRRTADIDIDQSGRTTADIDIDQSGHRTADDCTLSASMASSSDVDTSSVTSESPVELERSGRGYMKHKRRMMERFLKEESYSSSPAQDAISPEKSSRKQLNTLELSAVDALISMGTQVEMDSIITQR